MLVLSRRRGKTLVIVHPSDPDHPIEITVVDIRGDRVRIGITAEKSIPVHRKEVWEAIQAENREAAERVAAHEGGLLTHGDR